MVIFAGLLRGYLWMANEKHGLNDLCRRAVYNCFLTFPQHCILKENERRNGISWCYSQICFHVWALIAPASASEVTVTWGVYGLWQKLLFSVLGETFFSQCLILQLLKTYTMLFFLNHKCIKIDILPERTLNSIHFKYSSDPLLNNFHSVGLSVCPLLSWFSLFVVMESQNCRG